MEKYDIVIIGGGLAGLAAGVRLAHFGKKICILEAHYAPGGLNSYYKRAGRNFDSGLHAWTNYVPKGTRGAAMTKLLRQLRIKHDELELAEQSSSLVKFPSCSLRFTNEFETLRSEIADKFPAEIDGFDKLSNAINEYDETSYEAKEASARERMKEYIKDPLLQEMIFCPLMYYGCSSENDMDWTQFVLVWKCLFTTGLARPRNGLRHVIGLLTTRLQENGGELRMSSRVIGIRTNKGKATGVVLENGTEIDADMIMSSAGYPETMNLCESSENILRDNDCGKISLVEVVACLDTDPQKLGMKDTIIFFNNSDTFEWNEPEERTSLRSGVICVPNTYKFDPPLEEGRVRMTALASFGKWHETLGADKASEASQEARSSYNRAKAEDEKRVIDEACRHIPDFRSNIEFSDFFTPLTIKRFTGHINGALYGSPHKHRSGKTAFENLYLIGTDQGFHGIVGAMLSGISMANLHCLA